jgi:cytochrome c
MNLAALALPFAAKSPLFLRDGSVIQAITGAQDRVFAMHKGFLALALLAASTMVAAAAGDAKSGAQVFKKCAMCHTAEKNGGDSIGPNLYGVVGRKAATKPGYSYSAALKKLGVTWDEASLTKWVSGPGRMAPGTKMTFAGLSSKKQQADVVAYLSTLK